MKKLEKDALLADRAAVQNILTDISPDDLVGKLSFESRLGDIDSRLRELDSTITTRGSVALMFAGEPVHGSRTIDASFGSNMLSIFQDIVTRKVAAEEIGSLGSRGPIPLQLETNLGIADVIRGSVGFVLEESSRNESLADTAIKKAIDDVTVVIEHAASSNPADFEEIVEGLNARLLGALGNFFSTLEDNHATVRIVEDERDASLDSAAIRRARDRISSTEIIDKEDDNIVGRLIGVVPNLRRFELELAAGQIVRGAIAAEVASRYMDLISDPTHSIVGRRWRVKLRTREVRERNKLPRFVYTLMGLLEEFPEA
jgi:hypothetical protein